MEKSRNTVAWVALVIAIIGTGLAASRFIVPVSRGPRGPAGVAGPVGPRGLAASGGEAEEAKEEAEGAKTEAEDAKQEAEDAKNKIDSLCSTLELASSSELSDVGLEGC